MNEAVWHGWGGLSLVERLEAIRWPLPEARESCPHLSYLGITCPVSSAHSYREWSAHACCWCLRRSGNSMCGDAEAPLTAASRPVASRGAVLATWAEREYRRRQAAPNIRFQMSGRAVWPTGPRPSAKAKLRPDLPPPCAHLHSRHGGSTGLTGAAAGFAARSVETQLSPVRLHMAAGPTRLPTSDIARLPPHGR